MTAANEQVASASEPEPATLSTPEHYDRARAALGTANSGKRLSVSSVSSTSSPPGLLVHPSGGFCAYRLGQHHDAHAAFRTSIALAPNSAECYYNRARAAEALGRSDQAKSDYNRALELDPALTPALINRGILAHKSGKYDDAVTDFRQAIRPATDSRT